MKILATWRANANFERSRFFANSRNRYGAFLSRRQDSCCRHRGDAGIRRLPLNKVRRIGCASVVVRFDSPELELSARRHESIGIRRHADADGIDDRLRWFSGAWSFSD